MDHVLDLLHTTSHTPLGNIGDMGETKADEADEADERVGG